MSLVYLLCTIINIMMYYVPNFNNVLIFKNKFDWKFLIYRTSTNQFEISQNWEHTFTIPTKSYP